MINYLNSTKRLFVALTTTTALAGSLSLVSCQDYDNGFDEKEIFAKEYSNNFVKYFGKIDPNHEWGISKISSMPFFGESRTRLESGGAGYVNVNINQWAAKSGDHYINEAIAPYVDIPGFPNFDGFYYTKKGIVRESDITNDHHPVGDVTDYEIQVVSQWFRTHKITNPQDYRINLHISDFFIQDVCSDADQFAYPEGGNNYRPGTKKEETYFQMDQLRFKTLESNSTIDETWTHVNNFNRNTQNFDPENSTSTDFRTIMYITSSGTEDFAYHPSHNDDGRFYDNWVLVHLTWKEIGHDGIEHTRDGYYLAFDYEADKTSSGDHVAPDGYYSNWIVKITPAKYIIQDEWPRRIMCEDLGNTFDYDFNDVVYDIFFQNVDNTRSEAVITIQAAGGTLPIYVGVNPGADGLSNAQYEAHRLLGQSTSSRPVNVKKGSSEHEPAIFRISKDASGNNFAADENDPDLVKIYVIKSTPTATNVAPEILQISKTQPGSNNTPQRFGCPPSVKWMQEEVFIDEGYPHFRDWVKAEHGAYREKENDPNPTEDFIGKWFEKDVNASVTCGRDGTPLTTTTPNGNIASSATALVSPFVSSEETALMRDGAELDLSKYMRTGVSATVSITEGNEYVRVSGTTVTAIKPGNAKLSITTNGTSGIYSSGTMTLDIEVFEPSSPFTEEGPVELSIYKNNVIDFDSYLKSVSRDFDVSFNPSDVLISQPVENKLYSYRANSIGSTEATITYKGNNERYINGSTLTISVTVSAAIIPFTGKEDVIIVKVGEEVDITDYVAEGIVASDLTYWGDIFYNVVVENSVLKGKFITTNDLTIYCKYSGPEGQYDTEVTKTLKVRVVEN